MGRLNFWLPTEGGTACKFNQLATPYLLLDCGISIEPKWRKVSRFKLVGLIQKWHLLSQYCVFCIRKCFAIYFPLLL